MKIYSAVLLFLLINSFTFSQCSGNEPVLFLGNDTTLCTGQSITLQASVGYDLYIWSNGSTNTNITASQPGTYYVSATMTSGGTNLVVNGDFENGATNFITDYIPGTGGSWGLLSNPSQYAISTSPNLVHNNFYPCSDHTTGTGNMYIANGSDIANTIVWEQNIAVIPNTNYNFSAWFTSVENTSNPAILQFFVNNIQIGSVFSPSTSGCNWTEFFNLWNSGGSTNATIAIKNQNIDGSGNDFAIDDITFTSYCTNTDTIIVANDLTTISAGSDISFCDYSPVNLTAQSNDPSVSFLWSTSETTSTITPTASGVYTVSTITANNCTLQDNVNVTVNTAPTAVLLTTVNETCSQNNGQVQIGTLSGGSAPYQFNFNSLGFNTTTTFTNLDQGNYSLIVKDANGCIYTPASITLTDTPSPTDLNLLGINASCELSNGSISVLNTVGGAQPYIYSINNQAYSNNTSFSNLISGTYSISVQDANSCNYTENIVITTTSKPVANFVCPATFEEGENEIHLNNLSSNDVVNTTWTIPNGSPSSSTSTNPSITFTNLSEGFYPITLTVSNQDGCIDSITKYIEYKTMSIIYAPNTFTPDGDNYNNDWQFFISGFDTERFSVKIFDKWGELIWETTDPTSTWNGHYKEKMVQNGMYTWVMTASVQSNDDVKFFTGHVNVLY